MEKGYDNIPVNFSIDNLIAIRKQFLNYWNENYVNKYPNLVLDYHNLLMQYNLFDAYFYWSVQMGDIDGFQKWIADNKTQYENFLDWFNENAMSFSEEFKTNRFAYE